MHDDGYRWVDHTAELELEIRGGTARAVFAEALRAFAELAGDGHMPRHAGAVWREIVLEANERAVLLAQWLDELAYLAETEDLVPEAIEAFDLADSGLRATVRGHTGRPRNVIKGVTYHRLSFARAGDGFRATVILDV
ncbi:MAG TPA: archease [Solirubrobacteraceae bacterium]|nr:archease [Solirubrobacteraceae bacterium]